MSDIYVVLSINLIIWGGLFSYLFVLDRKIRKLKKSMDNESKMAG